MPCFKDFALIFFNIKLILFFKNKSTAISLDAFKTIEKLSQDNSLMKKNIDEITSIILSD